MINIVNSPCPSNENIEEISQKSNFSPIVKDDPGNKPTSYETIFTNKNDKWNFIAQSDEESSEEKKKQDKKEIIEEKEKEVKIIEIKEESIEEFIEESKKASIEKIYEGVCYKKDIIRIFEKNRLKIVNIDKYLKIIKNNKLNKIIKKEMKLIETKRKKKAKIKILKKERKNRGRKRNGDDTKSGHNKNSSDNILKKIKKYFLQKLIIGINSIISNLKNSKNFQLKKLDYGQVRNLNKKFELQNLNMTLKEILSCPISCKYRSNDSDYNKKNIQKILRKEKNNEAIQYVFNLTFKEWIDIFTMKKDSLIKDVKFDGLDSVLEDVLQKNNDDERYFFDFIFCLYNYEHWFLNKQDRNINRK